jgi:hypothetical protein
MSPEAFSWWKIAVEVKKDAYPLLAALRARVAQAGILDLKEGKLK